MKLDNEIQKIFNSERLSFGRCLGSKIGYEEKHPNSLVIFNARIYDLRTFSKHKDGAILDWFKGQELELWYGDIDLSLDIMRLYNISKKIGSIVITNETGRPFITVH